MNFGEEKEIFDKKLQICINSAKNAENKNILCFMQSFQTCRDAKSAILHFSAKGAISPKFTKKVRKSRNFAILVKFRTFAPRAENPL